MPPRNESFPAEEAEPQKTEGMSRRRFHTGIIYGLWGLIVAALGGQSLAYLLVPSRVRREDEWIEAGDVSHLMAGVPAELTFRRNRVDGWRVASEKTTVWAVKTDETHVTAFAPQCTHLGCAYHWEQSRMQFLCPCHNSVFSVTGDVVDGPAPRPLDRYDTKVMDNKLLIGPLRPKTEEKA
jgi:quinol---cytochrome c reductase iron-sulfur subunit, bacillus type